jgi:hypothetical protein
MGFQLNQTLSRRFLQTAIKLLLQTTQVVDGTFLVTFCFSAATTSFKSKKNI